MVQAFKRLRERLRRTENPFLRSALKHSPWYLGASLFSGVVSLVMTKYYTHVFDPAAYGVLALYILLFQYMQSVVAFSVDSAAQRVYFDYEGEQRAEFVGTTVMFMLVSSVFWIAIAYVAKSAVNAFLGGSELVYAATIALVVVYAFTNLLIRFAYNEHRSTLVARQGVLQTTLNHAFSVAFIALGNLGILGYQLGSLFSYSATGVLYGVSLRRLGDLRIRFKFRRDVMRRLLHFSVPTFFSAVISSAVSALDRLFLNAYSGASQVGVYSLGYNLAQGMTLVVDAISLALFPSLMKELQSDYDTNIQKLKRFDRWFWTGLFVVAGAVFVLRVPIVAVLSNAQYASAADVLPVIVMTFVLGGLYKTSAGLLSYHGIVRFYPPLTAVSFMVTAVANYVLVPRFGQVGAAYGSFLGVFVYSITIQAIASKYLHSRSVVALTYGSILVLVTAWFAYLAVWS